MQPINQLQLKQEIATPKRRHHHSCLELEDDTVHNVNKNRNQLFTSHANLNYQSDGER